MDLAERIAYARKRLDECEKPLFIYDDDTDGVASFLLTYRGREKGTGMINKIGKVVDERFLQKVNDVNPDVIFILDVPVLSVDFAREAKREIIWVDHHVAETLDMKNVTQVNPTLHGEPAYPTSYWAYRIAGGEPWIAMIGIAGDWWVIPEMSEKLRAEFPNLLSSDVKEPGQQKFDTPIGELSNIIQFNLKGTAVEAMQSVKVLSRIESPYEILEKSSARGRFIHKKYSTIEKKYSAYLKEILVTDEKLIVKVFPPEMPLSSELANEVLHRNPGKDAIICREFDGRIVCSVRGGKHGIRKPMLKALENLDGNGGGHDKSCGMSIRKDHWDEFLKRFKKALYE